jgi:hypothetical protein
MQELKELGAEKWLHYCRWFRFFIGSNATDISCRIFFNKETWFYLRGPVNGQNSKALSKENCHFFRETPLHTKIGGVFCGFTSSSVLNILLQGHSWGNLKLGFNTSLLCYSTVTNFAVGFSKTWVVWLLNRAVVESPNHPYPGRDFKLVLPSRWADYCFNIFSHAHVHILCISFTSDFSAQKLYTLFHTISYFIRSASILVQNLLQYLMNLRVSPNGL